MLNSGIMNSYKFQKISINHERRKIIHENNVVEVQNHHS